MDPREYFRQFADDEEFERIVEKPTVTAMWRDCTAEFADRDAIVFKGESYTFAQLESDAAGFRTVLDNTVKDGKRVGILSANSYDFVKAYLAVVTTGRTAVILPAHLDQRSVFGCSIMFGLDAVIYQPELKESVSLVKVPLIDITLTSDEKTGMTDCDEKTPCVMMFTGGTTGKSKCALLSNGAVMQGTVNGCYGISPVFGQRYMLVLPLSRTYPQPHDLALHGQHDVDLHKQQGYVPRHSGFQAHSARIRTRAR